MDPNFDTRSLRVADTHPEDLVAWFEVGYVPANGFNQAGHINAWPAVPRDLRFTQPKHDAKDIRHAFQLALLATSVGSVLPTSRLYGSTTELTALGCEQHDFAPVRQRVLQAVASGKTTGVSVAMVHKGRLVRALSVEGSAPVSHLH